MSDEHDSKKAATTAGYIISRDAIGRAQDLAGPANAMSVGFGMLQGVLRSWRSGMRRMTEAEFEEAVQANIQLALQFVRSVRATDAAVERAANQDDPTLN